MIVGGYSLHLYCDCEKCTSKEGMKVCVVGEFFGINTDEAFKFADLRGWKFSADMAKCFAPKHKVPKS